ncbi:hypothetical protein ACF0H5_000923 [Mactra antiquata]
MAGFPTERMEHLAEFYTRIEEQKLKHEKLIQGIRHLFKPWPIAEQESNTNSQNNTQVNGKNTLNVAEDKQVPALTSAEQESLMLVDKMLMKAEKARNIQKKLEEPRKSYLKGVSNRETKLDNATSVRKSQNENDMLGCESKISPRSEKTESDKEIDENSKLKPFSKNHTSASKSGRHVSNRAKPETLGSKSATSSATNKTSASRLYTNSRVSSNSKLSQRPQSASSHKANIPVHASAPFKTDPNLGNSKLRTTYSATNAKTFSKSRGATNSARGRGRANVNQVRISTKASTHSSSVTQPSKGSTLQSEEISSTACKENKNIDSNNSGDGYVQTNKEVGSEKIENKASEISNSPRDTDTNVPTTNSVKTQLIEKKGFDLSKDGATLTIPGKLKKLLHHNQKLRQKLNTLNLKKKVDCPDTAEQYTLMVEQFFCDKEEQYIQHEGRKAQQILHTYTYLTSLLDSLNLEKLTVDTHPEDIYRCKKIMEYILIKYQETEELLHTINFGKLSTISTFRGSKEQTTPVSTVDHSYLWYTRNLPAGRPPQYGYKYSSYKQLERYTDIMYQLQLTQLQIDVMDTVARLLLPLLKSLDPASSEYVQVLRASYSLLSVNHHCIPVIVKDTIQDETTHELYNDDEDDDDDEQS